MDDGVLKMGRTEGDWTVLVSPSHWAVIEVGNAASRAHGDGDQSDEHDESDSEAADQDSGDDGDKKDG